MIGMYRLSLNAGCDPTILVTIINAHGASPDPDTCPHTLAAPTAPRGA